jgi:hypothetical protein
VTILDFRFAHTQLQEYVAPSGEQQATCRAVSFVKLQVAVGEEYTSARSYSAGSVVTWRDATPSDLLELGDFIRAKYAPPRIDPDAQLEQLVANKLDSEDWIRTRVLPLFVRHFTTST